MICNSWTLSEMKSIFSPVLLNDTCLNSFYGDFLLLFSHLYCCYCRWWIIFLHMTCKSTSLQWGSQNTHKQYTHTNQMISAIWIPYLMCNILCENCKCLWSWWKRKNSESKERERKKTTHLKSPSYFDASMLIYNSICRCSTIISHLFPLWSITVNGAFHRIDNNAFFWVSRPQ